MVQSYFCEILVDLKIEFKLVHKMHKSTARTHSGVRVATTTTTTLNADVQL